jgi:hypothetical protein
MIKIPLVVEFDDDGERAKESDLFFGSRKQITSKAPGLWRILKS